MDEDMVKNDHHMIVITNRKENVMFSWVEAKRERKKTFRKIERSLKQKKKER